MTATTALLCERCRKRAAVIYKRGEDDTFPMCGHHGREHDTELIRLGYIRQTLDAMTASR